MVKEPHPSDAGDGFSMTPKSFKTAGAAPSPAKGQTLVETGQTPQEESLAAWRPELQAAEAAAEEGLPIAQTATGLKAYMTRANIFFFGIFLIGVGLVAFMSLRGGPDKSSAAQEKKQQEVDSAIKKFLARQEAIQQSSSDKPAADASKKSRSPEALMKDTQGLVDMFYNFTAKNQVPLEDLRANPFEFKLEDSEAAAEAARKQKEADEAAHKKKAELAAKDLQKLTLQSILSGPSGYQAMINSTIVRPGSVIEGFTVDDIQPRWVSLSRDGAKFRLEMTY
ncbi:MAG: hypothetical protein BIFFINMI_04001 [Phycisphaerae bacterium]|nr:hypothetical protein [Phycisphaerae bacterium]